MTLEEAHDFIFDVVVDAAIEIGSKQELARFFGVRPAAVSQWLRRRRFPSAIAWDMHQIVAGKYSLEDIQRALFFIEYSPERHKGA